MLRLAVVGAGVMGANHARVATAHRDVELVAVVDGDMARAASAAAAAGARHFPSVGSMLAELTGEARPRAAVVAVPTPHHASVVGELIEAGIHVLVEKPIAATVDEARAMVAAASSAGLVLMVGHIERFNSVVAELQRLPEPPIHIEAHRMGPFSARIGDDVILDLMIHDLDVARLLARAPVVSVEAVGRAVRTSSEDLAVALLRFANGTSATITASRVAQQKIRQLQLTMPDSFIVADLIRQDISVTRVEHVEYVSSTGTSYRQTAAVEIPFLENRGEPLAQELTAFARAVQDGATPPVTGEDGIEALQLVLAVRAAARGA